MKNRWLPWGLLGVSLGAGSLVAADFAWEVDYQNSLRVRSVQRTSDGGMILAGYGYIPPGTVSLIAIKLTATGGLEWTRSVGGNQNDYGETVLELPGGGYAICGNTWTWGNGVAMVVRLNPDGTLNWFRVLGPNSSGQVWDMILLSDGLLVVGQCDGQSSAFAAKLDMSGNLLWMKTYSYSSDLELFYGASVASDGNPVLAGLVEFGPYGGDDIWVMKVSSSNGDPIWCRIIGSPGSDEALSLVEDASGNLLVAASTNYTQLHNWDFLAIKMTPSGSLAWVNRVGQSANIGEGVLYSQTAALTQDNGMVMLGRGTVGSDTVIMLVKMNPDGSLAWSRGIETQNDYIGGGGVVPERDGGFLMAADKIPPASTILVAGFPADGANCDSYDIPMVITPWSNYYSQSFIPTTQSFTNISQETPQVLSFTPTVDTLCQTLGQSEACEGPGVSLVPIPGGVMVRATGPQRIVLNAYDPAGRPVARLFSGIVALGRSVYYLPETLGPGVYMIVAETPGGTRGLKLVKP